MLIIPAIDIKNGKCVRLIQGQMDKETIYSDDPVAMADKWVEAGARRLHIVDLDGAINGRLSNADVVNAIAEAHPDIPLQVGGGIRDEDSIQTYLMSVSLMSLSEHVLLPHHILFPMFVLNFQAILL